MTNQELLVEVKAGLGIPSAVTAFDAVLTQKLKAVQGYMTGAGVSDTVLASDAAVGAIVIGTTDMWSIQGGEAKFSPLFHSLTAQLASRSLPPEETET
jgi:hypothetical protein